MNKVAVDAVVLGRCDSLNYVTAAVHSASLLGKGANVSSKVEVEVLPSSLCRYPSSLSLDACT